MTVLLWNARSADWKKPPFRLNTSQAKVTCLAFSPDDRRLLAGHADGTSRIWDLQPVQAQPQWVFPGHGQPASAVLFSPDARSAFTGCLDSTTRVWDVSSAAFAGTEPRIIRGGHSPISAIVLRKDGRELMTGDGQGCVRRWNLSGQREAVPVGKPWKTGPGIATMARGDRDVLLTAHVDQALRKWDLSKETPLVPEFRSGQRFLASAFSQGGGLFAAARDDRVVAVWDTQDPDPQRPLMTWTVPAEQADAIRTLAFSPDRKWLVAGAGQKAYMWDLGRRLPQGKEVQAPSFILSVAASDDLLAGRRLRDTTVRVWQRDEEDRLQPRIVLRGHTARVTGLAMPSDGRRVLSATAPIAPPESGTSLPRIPRWKPLCCGVTRMH